ncbi:hypothetical protein QAD02_020122 [Eretmocerus hayati]|uniref:Uncharacterized protein n=1 Tax=Eretmocerus hayati TaxID=131215 RepID=A0ACC2PRB3_9HYME|nr:hypothetical protein QAD02_020122 [Eretmocerus hayati]
MEQPTTIENLIERITGACNQFEERDFEMIEEKLERRLQRLINNQGGRTEGNGSRDRMFIGFHLNNLSILDGDESVADNRRFNKSKFCGLEDTVTQLNIDAILITQLSKLGFLHLTQIDNAQDTVQRHV